MFSIALSSIEFGQLSARIALAKILGDFGLRIVRILTSSFANTPSVRLKQQLSMQELTQALT